MTAFVNVSHPIPCLPYYTFYLKNGAVRFLPHNKQQRTRGGIFTNQIKIQENKTN